MKTIHKATSNRLLPSDARPLCAQVQHGMVCVWYETDTDTDRMLTRSIVIVGTGHEVPSNADYFGTVQDGPYVWHVYIERALPSAAAGVERE